MSQFRGLRTARRSDTSEITMTHLTYVLRAQAEKAKQERRERFLRMTNEYDDYLVSDVLGEKPHLPYPKEELSRAFLFCIANAKSKHEIDLLEKALWTLAFRQDAGEDDDLSDSERLSKISKDLRHFELWAKKAREVNENIWPYYKTWWEKLRSSEFRTIPAEWIDFPD